MCVIASNNLSKAVSNKVPRCILLRERRPIDRGYHKPWLQKSTILTNLNPHWPHMTYCKRWGSGTQIVPASMHTSRLQDRGPARRRRTRAMRHKNIFFPRSRDRIAVLFPLFLHGSVRGPLSRHRRSAVMTVERET